MAKLANPRTISDYNDNRISSTVTYANSFKTLKNTGIKASTIADAFKPTSSLFQKFPSTSYAKLAEALSYDDSNNAEVIKSGVKESRLYQLHTGLSEKVPLIVLASNFVPIYESGKQNDKGQALSVKSTALLLNAKTAVTSLAAVKGVGDKITTNKSELKAFIDAESQFFSELVKKLVGALNSLDPTTFIVPSSKSNNDIKEIIAYPQIVASLPELLNLGGYDYADAFKFSRTKMWDQALIEFKKILMTHSSTLIPGTRKKEPADSDPYLLSDVKHQPSGVVRAWLNPNLYGVPTESDIEITSAPEQIDQTTLWTEDTDGSDALSDTSSSKSSSSKVQNAPAYTDVAPSDITKSVLKKLSIIDEKLYIDLNVKQGSMSYKTIDPSSLNSDDKNGSDIALASHILFKESSVSSFVKQKNYKETLKNTYGYDVDDANNSNESHAQMWDHIVGRFSDSSLDLVVNPVGNGNSLASFAKEAYPDETTEATDDYYNVATLECSFLDNENVVPGSYYYIERSMNLVNGSKFDLSPIGKLSSKARRATDALDTTMIATGYSRTGQEANGMTVYNRSPVNSSLSFDGIVEKLSVITELYSKCVTFELTDTANGGSGKTSKYKLSVDALSSLTDTERLDVRLAAAICKACAGANFSGSYTTGHKTLKGYLFLLLMNSVFLKANRRSSFKKNVKDPSVEPQSTPYTGFLSKLLFAELAKAGSLEGVPTAEQEMRFFPLNIRETASIEAGGDVSTAIIRDEVDMIKFDYTKGLWRVMSDLMLDVYQADIYVTQGSSSVTAYSKIPKVVYMYAYFDLLLRMIVGHTPEEISGISLSNVQQSAPLSIPGLGAYTSANVYSVKRGLILSRINGQDSKLFTNIWQMGKLLKKDPQVLKSPAVVISNSNASVQIKQENLTVTQTVDVMRRFLTNLNTKVDALKSHLTANFANHIQRMLPVYAADEDLLPDQKSALANLSFSEDQIILSQYVMSELSDRLSESSDFASKLKKLPAFADFPDNFLDYVNLNETDLSSYQHLSSYFNSNNFYRNLGGNKKILSIGVPPRLKRLMHSTSRSSNSPEERIMGSIVRVKVYKNDRLHPDVVYSPQEFLFETSRFPTRMLKNWEYDTLSTNDDVIFNIPCKIYDPSSPNSFRVCKTFDGAFPSALYGNEAGKLLSEEDKFEIYSNHSISFFLEEYLRWFTDTQFDETRYYNYTQVSDTMKNIEAQYDEIIKHVSAESKQPSSNDSSVQAVFVDKNGNSHTIPVKSNSGNADNNQPAASITMNDTMELFLRNETLLMTPDYIKKRILYPKKFDRVFHLLVDPDDFYVDTTMTSQPSISSLTAAGVLKKTDSGQYKHRDTTDKDISLDEYFVTIEPYFYTPEYEV